MGGCYTAAALFVIGSLTGMSSWPARRHTEIGRRQERIRSERYAREQAEASSRPRQLLLASLADVLVPDLGMLAR